MRLTIPTVLLAVLCSSAEAEVRLTVDATAPVAVRRTGYARLGTAIAPDGTVLGVNSRYLTLAAKPWLPVMGEFHFARLPREEWDGELAKVKASGVDVVASYLFWNYHEEAPGQFNWSGDRDVRGFVEAAARHGLKVIIRLGPWAHGEVRYGGIPDWIVRALPTRSSDPTYLRYVDRYWEQIAIQLKGLLWKDGGPIIGIQLENEYNLTGQLQGRQHIADLKAIALRHGFDVPFTTVTGWDATVYPHREVLPVFGGYPDEPWGLTTGKLPPKETYAFRFDSRVSGNLGATTQGSNGDADPDIPFTPFLGAEFGGGVPTMYRRRPIIQPDDIAAMVPVELGSGVNLYGYYMIHGGRNLIQRTTMEENAAIGGYNDLPLIEYDFQAPFGEYGESGAVTERIRPFHLFLQSYGDQLAPMTVRRPAVTPSALDDLKTLRWSARASGNSAFIFVSNHIRQYATPPHPDTRFSVRLPQGTVTLPPVTVPSGAYFVWPVGLDLGGQSLAWATAQPITRIDTPEGPLHVFAATDGIAPRFAFAAGTKIMGASSRNIDGLVVAAPVPGMGAISISRSGSPPIRIMVLDQASARRLWKADFAGQPHLVITPDELVDQGRTLAFTSLDEPEFQFAAFPSLPAATRGNLALKRTADQGLFARYSALAQTRAPKATITMSRRPGEAPPIPIGGTANRAIQPYPESFGRAAGAWRIAIAPGALDGLDDAFLDIDWVGDIGRLFASETLIDDRFYDGRHWRVGLKRQRASIGGPLTLAVMPLRADAPIYLDERVKRPATGQAAEARSVTIQPQYRLTLTTGN